jgi:16S rRNA C1402 (ribose-2'-O) methylase RsmI
MYALICLSLVLVGIVGLQFTYLFYIDRIYKERRKYLQTLENKHAKLVSQLETAERRIAQQDDLLNSLHPELAGADDGWAEVIEER